MRLGLGAAALSAGAIVAALVLYFGMSDVAKRLETALASEQRMTRYSALSTQISTFLVIATESVQTGLSPGERMARIQPTADRIEQVFVFLRSDLEKAVESARSIGVDQQSRFGTQSLGLARMEALLHRTLVGLADPDGDAPRLRAHLDSFAGSFDPLLNQAVNTERLFRNNALQGIEALRHRLAVTAALIAALSVLGVLFFYIALVRPQFSRLEKLHAAAQKIGSEDFSLSLPVTRLDEIGRLYSATNRMAQALARRQERVETEWSKLNSVIDRRTQELRAANQRLEEIDENRRRFFADVSHELRTPLTVILMEAQIGKQGNGPDAQAFATIENRAARLNRRIDDLLRVAKSENGQLAFDPRPVELSEIIKATLQEIRAEVESAGMTLDTDPPPDVRLTCDPNWIRQVIVGVIRNAIRHARSGIHMRLSCTVSASGVAISLRDNGPGIPKDDQEKIFDRFSQSAGHKAQGFGVGLALAAWVIGAHGGRIHAMSPIPAARALGKNPGCDITLQLPLSPVPDLHAPNVKEPNFKEEDPTCLTDAC
ncbi:HAMP domain-containing sensor histidine kinase [Phaeobacter sp. B1627]|uniref:sensor histidine kinase n=1 Tax=Phaeobacter sp. B1627 TaxID=2583809 RepID=UPI001118FADF|nr:HAMP domain-containing sensor histidine kinase [Phaeobacter sp. B1627]TNJ47437.1 HAMP domain-containing histidine kinase [Phaeobacter sp. B1627]